MKTLKTVDGSDSYVGVDVCPQADGKLTELGLTEGCWIILRIPTGRFYTAQTHGMACFHPLMEGFIVTLEPIDIPHIGCWGNITRDDQAALGPVLAPLGIEIDSEELDATITNGRPETYGEAWIPIKWGSARGILVYGNCD